MKNICGTDPIFIGCMPRSGSSLLRVMMDSHPMLAADREIGWYFSKHPEKLLLASFKRVGSRFVNKEPKSISKRGLKTLKKLFGDNLSFIHIYRKPEDIYISYAKTGISPQEFVKDAECYLSGLESQHWPTKLMRLSYESLVLDTTIQLGRICQFLSIPYSGQMLHHCRQKHRVNDHYSDIQAQQPVFTASIGQSEGKDLPKQIRILCKRMEELQEAYDG